MLRDDKVVFWLDTGRPKQVCKREYSGPQLLASCAKSFTYGFVCTSFDRPSIDTPTWSMKLSSRGLIKDSWEIVLGLGRYITVVLPPAYA